MQHLHDKQIHNIKSEWEHDKMQSNRAIKSLEDLIK